MFAHFLSGQCMGFMDLRGFDVGFFRVQGITVVHDSRVLVAAIC